MPGETKHKFIAASLRFQKMEVCYPGQKGLPFGEMAVIKRADYCCRNNLPMDAAQVGSMLNISRPAVSQILNSLEKKGCITRSIDEHDRRKIRVIPTAQGLKALEQSEQSYDRVLQQLFALYGEKQILELTEQLNRLADLYEQLRRQPKEEQA